MRLWWPSSTPPFRNVTTGRIDALSKACLTSCELLQRMCLAEDGSCELLQRMCLLLLGRLKLKASRVGGRHGLGWGKRLGGTYSVYKVPEL